MAKQFMRENDMQVIRFKQDGAYRICYLIYDKNNGNAEEIYGSISKYKYLTEDKLKLTEVEIIYEI